MKTADSIKMYCSTICDLHEIKGFPPIVRTKRYHKTIMAICRTLRHEIKQAQPITVDIFKRMLPFVDVNNQKQLAIWVAILFGFFLFLRKSNLVPDGRVHDSVHQLSRRDIKIDESLLIVNIKCQRQFSFNNANCKFQWWKIPLLRSVPISGWFSCLTELQQGQHTICSHLSTMVRYCLLHIGIWQYRWGNGWKWQESRIPTPSAPTP